MTARVVLGAGVQSKRQIVCVSLKAGFYVVSPSTPPVAALGRSPHVLWLLVVFSVLLRCLLQCSVSVGDVPCRGQKYLLLDQQSSL